MNNVHCYGEYKNKIEYVNYFPSTQCKFKRALVMFKPGIFSIIEW